MSGRSGYVEDGDMEPQDFAMWRGRVFSAIRGKRGQRLIRDLKAALEAMPVKRLIANDIVDEEGEVCALGCVGKYRRRSGLRDIDPEDHNALSKMFDIAECLVQEIEWENDESGYGRNAAANRHAHMLAWCNKQLRPDDSACQSLTKERKTR